MQRCRCSVRLLLRSAERCRNYSTSTTTETAPLQHKIIVIAGTTDGKFDIGVRVARAVDGEIVSVDSAQVYRELNVGANKPPIAEKSGIPHHMISVCSLKDESEQLRGQFNVVRFCEMARPIVDDIVSRGKVPILIGGSGFYLRSFLYGTPESKATDIGLYERIRADLIAENDWKKSISRLAETSAEYAETIPQNNYNRLARALEIVARTGKALSPESRSKPPLYDFRGVFLYRNRFSHAQEIIDRSVLMIHRGLVQETVQLLRSGFLLPDSPAGKTMSYRQTIRFLKDTQYPVVYEELNAFLNDLRLATKEYIRKQTTWFRREQFYRWLNTDEYEYADEIVDAIVALWRMPRSEFDVAVNSRAPIKGSNQQTASNQSSTVSSDSDTTESKPQSFDRYVDDYWTSHRQRRIRQSSMEYGLEAQLMEINRYLQTIRWEEQHKNQQQPSASDSNHNNGNDALRDQSSQSPMDNNTHTEKDDIQIEASVQQSKNTQSANKSLFASLCRRTS